MKQHIKDRGLVLSTISFIVLIVAAFISSLVNWWAWYTVVLGTLMFMAGLCMAIFIQLGDSVTSSKEETQ